MIWVPYLFLSSVLISLWWSNHAAFKMGYSRGCLEMLRKLKQLDSEFELRKSDDANFNKVKKEFYQYLIDIQPEKLKAPGLLEHLLTQSKWKHF